jgi:hypothetical protein
LICFQKKIRLIYFFFKKIIATSDEITLLRLFKIRSFDSWLTSNFPIVISPAEIASDVNQDLSGIIISKTDEASVSDKKSEFSHVQDVRNSSNMNILETNEELYAEELPSSNLIKVCIAEDENSPSSSHKADSCQLPPSSIHSVNINSDRKRALVCELNEGEEYGLSDISSYFSCSNIDVQGFIDDSYINALKREEERVCSDTIVLKPLFSRVTNVNSRDFFPYKKKRLLESSKCIIFVDQKVPTVEPKLVYQVECADIGESSFDLDMLYP